MHLVICSISSPRAGVPLLAECRASSYADDKMAVDDPEEGPSRQKRHAGSAVLCRRHDDRCYAAELYIVSFNFKWIDGEWNAV